MIVDLHCHSTASDGVLAPTKLVERAHGRGVQLLALTDTTPSMASPRLGRLRWRWGCSW